MMNNQIEFLTITDDAGIALYYIDPKLERVMPAIRGGEGDGGIPNPDAPNQSATLTEAQATAIAEREKAAGNRAGKSEALEALGFESEEDAQKAIKAYRDHEESKKDEVQKALEAAEAREAEAKTRISEAATSKLQANIREAMASANVNAEYSGLLLGDLMTELAGQEIGESTISEAIKKRTESMPALFGAPADPPPPGAPGTGGTRRPAGKPNGESTSRLKTGAERHAKAHPTTA